MNNIHFEFYKADNTLKNFADENEKFILRYSAIYDEMKNFIVANNLEKEAYINEIALGYALLDYFEDIARLKEYHRVSHINSIKIVAYTSYWLLKRKPIQISKKENDRRLVYINERFVLSYILSFLGESEKPILKQDKKGLQAFGESILYYLKYRLTSPYSLEMILMAFFAGQIYQEEKTDLSDKISNMLYPNNNI